MARTGIRYEQVADIAEQLFAEGREPSLLLIRAGLGNTGSFTTIANHLKAWQESRVKIIEPQLFDMPDGVRKVLDKTWPALQTEANNLIESVRANLMQHVDEAKNREVEMATELEHVEKANDNLKTDLNLIQGRCQELECQLAVANEQLNETNARVLTAENDKDHAIRSGEIARIEAAQAKHDLEQADRETTDAKNRAENFAENFEQLRARISDAERIAAVAEARATEIEKSTLNFIQRLTTAEARADKFSTQVDSYVQAITHAERRAVLAEAKNIDLQQEIHSLIAKKSEAKVVSP